VSKKWGPLQTTCAIIAPDGHSRPMSHLRFRASRAGRYVNVSVLIQLLHTEISDCRQRAPSHIRRYPSAANHCPYCFGIALLRSFKPAAKVQKRRLRGRKTENRAQNMEYYTLPLSCRCGGVPKQIAAVGLSSTHDLVIHWRCPRCRKNVCTVKPLSDCWRDCFTPGLANLSNSKTTVETPDDRQFLHRMGVRYSDE